MGLYINNKNLAKPYKNGVKYNCYFNGQRIWKPSYKRFVAISAVVSTSNSAIVYTDNGINWTQATNPTSSGLNKVVFCNNKFYILSNNYFLISNDGINWTTINLPSSTSWNQLAYGNDRFVIFSMNNDNKAAYSTNGTNWTETTLPYTASDKNLRFFNGKFVSYNLNYDYGIYNCWTSTNGISWSNTQVNQDYSKAVECNGKLFIISGYFSNFKYSSNGTQWTDQALPSSQNWYGIAYGNNTYVILTQSGGIAAYSSNLSDWTQTTLPYDSLWENVIFGNGKFIAIPRYDSITGTSVTNKAGYSTNGKQWTGATLPISRYWIEIAYGESL